MALRPPPPSLQVNEVEAPKARETLSDADASGEVVGTSPYPTERLGSSGGTLRGPRGRGGVPLPPKVGGVWLVKTDSHAGEKTLNGPGQMLWPDAYSRHSL